jgi:hypothetical protein
MSEAMDISHSVGMTTDKTHIMLPLADPLARRCIFVYSVITKNARIKNFLSNILSSYAPDDTPPDASVIDTVAGTENLEDACELFGLIGHLN